MLFMGTLLLGVRLLSTLLFSFSLFELRLKPSNHVGLSIREAAAFEASLRSQSEALSHFMWVLSAMLAFIRLQNFAPEDSSLFGTLVTSLSKSLAHQASLTATRTAFLGLKRCQFYLSHLPSLMSTSGPCCHLLWCWPLPCSPNRMWLGCLLTLRRWSLRSQQPLVDVVAHGFGARSLI